MPVLSPVYSGPISTITDVSQVRSLPANNGFYVGPFDMSAIKAVDAHISVDMFCAAANTYRLDIGMLVSPDGTAWPNSAPSYAATTARIAGWPSYLTPVASIPFDSSYAKWSAPLTRFVGTLPQYFALYFYNNSNVAFDSSYTHRAWINFLQYEYV